MTYMGPLVCLILALRQRKAVMKTTNTNSTMPAPTAVRVMRPSVDSYQQASSVWQSEKPEWKRCIEERLLMYSFVNDK